MTCRTAILVVIALIAGCQREGPPRPERVPPPRASIAAPSTIDSAPGRPPRPVPSAIIRQRQSELAIPPRQSPSQRIAFSSRRFAVLGEQNFVVWERKNWKRVAKVHVEQPRAVVTMADGAFVVATGRGTLRLEQHETTPARLPRLMLLPGSQVWPDRRDPRALWVPLGQALHQYVLPGPEDPVPHRLVPAASHPMSEYDGHAFAGLKDGSFLYPTRGDLVRFFPGGKSTRGPAPIPGNDVWRLLSARRIDRAWVAEPNGTLHLVEFVAHFPVVRELEVAGNLHDIAVNDQHIAVVRIRSPANQARRWSVAVLDLEGRPSFEHPLPAGPPPDTEDWVARETLNRGIVLAPDDRCVAVGGPTWLSVWEIDSGRPLLPADVARRELASVPHQNSTPGALRD